MSRSFEHFYWSFLFLLLLGCSGGPGNLVTESKPTDQPVIPGYIVHPSDIAVQRGSERILFIDAAAGTAEGNAVATEDLYVHVWGVHLSTIRKIRGAISQSADLQGEKFGTLRPLADGSFHGKFTLAGVYSFILVFITDDPVGSTIPVVTHTDGDRTTVAYTSIEGEEIPPPQAVSSFSITKPGNTINTASPVVEWGEATGAADYDVIIATDEECNSPVQTFNGVTGTQLTLAPLVASGPFYACLEARYDNGTSLVASNTGYPFGFARGTLLWDVPSSINANHHVTSGAVDANGNYYVAGYGENLVGGSSGEDWFLRKFNSSGQEDTAWAKQFDGSDGNDRANSVAVTSSGEVYLVGYASNLVSGSSNKDWWAKKFQSDATEITSGWDKRLDLSSGLADHLEQVLVDSDGSVYLGGYANDPSQGFNWRLKKFQSNGTEVGGWDKVIDGEGGHDRAKALALDEQGNLVVAGSGTNLFTPSSGLNGWIKRFSSAGVESGAWDQKFNEGPELRIRSLTTDSDGNVYGVGYGLNLTSAASNYDWWIRKMNASGALVWQKKLDHGENSNRGFVVALSPDGNVFVGGNGKFLVNASSYSDGWIRKFSPEGVEDTSGAIIIDGNGGSQSVHAMNFDANGDLLVGVSGTSIPGAATTDYSYWILKYSRP